MHGLWPVAKGADLQAAPWFRLFKPSQHVRRVGASRQAKLHQIAPT